ncbi:MAG: formylglycine-generating enzyme family protein [Candidatus Sericytochromatia bacterium]
MVLVKKGTFKMQNTTEVKLSYDFYVGKYQVTQQLWKSIMGQENNPSNFVGELVPVQNITWFEAIKFCNALSKKYDLPIAYNEQTGELLDSNGNITTDINKVKGYRLLTEAEWEFTAKGGNLSQGYKFSGGNDINEISWYEDNSGRKPHDVGTKKPNELGIYDMNGNVWEWCTDYYDKDFYNIPQLENPVNMIPNTNKVRRGGSWRGSAGFFILTFRGFDDTYTYSRSNLGLRLALTF